MNNLIFNNREALPPPPKKNKFDFKKIKNNTFNSLKEVEYFLYDFKRFSNYIKLYKILK